MMSYPIQIPLASRPVLVVGGGAVAERKIRGLLEAEALVSVVSPEAGGAVEEWARTSRIALDRRAFRTEDVAGAALVFAATDDEEVNRAVSRAARDAGIPVNVADRPDLCTFTLPAVCRRGDLVLTASTSGRCPALARSIREDLETAYGPEYEDLVALMGRLRREMIRRGWGYGRTLDALAELYRDDMAGRIRRGDLEDLTRWLRRHLGQDWPLDHPIL